jgi:cysteine-S-conjugate beta-lyase
MVSEGEGMNGRFDFDTPVSRAGLGTLKEAVTSADMKAAGIVTLFGAEFEFKTAPSVIRAVMDMAENGLFAYTLQDDAFNSLVAGWMKTRRGWDVKNEWIVPTYGTMSALGTCIRTVTSPGNGVIVLLPGYFMYWSEITNNGRVRVGVPLYFDGGRYTVDFELLESALMDTNNTLLVLCSPHNPIGRVWCRDELERIAALAARYDVTVFSDEIFADVIYPGQSMLAFPQAGGGARCMVATSLGKAFSFTGIGQANLIIPDKELREAFLCQRRIGHYGSLDPVMRAAYFGAYSDDGVRWLDAMTAYCYANYLFADEYFRTRLPWFRIIRPEGTYVLWVDGRELGLSEPVLRELFTRARFGTDPGTDYGGEAGFFRINISVPRSSLQKALISLEEAVRNLTMSR